MYIELWVDVFKGTKRGSRRIDSRRERFVERWRKGNEMREENEKIKRDIFSRDKTDRYWAH